MNYIELINNFWERNLEFEFTGNEAKLYFYLVHICNSLGWRNPFRHSDRQISIGAGISLNSIKSGRNRLKQAGLIEFQTGRQGNRFDTKNKCQYQILSLSKKVYDTVDDKVHGTVDGKGDDTADGTVGINKLNKTKLKDQCDHSQPEKRTTRKKILDLEFAPEAYRPILEKWLSYRKEIKKPYKSQKSIEQFLTKLQELSGNSPKTAMEIINQSIASEYQGVFPLKKSDGAGRKIQVPESYKEKLGW